MKKIVIIFVLLNLFNLSKSQAQKTPKKDIDILYYKYKNSDSLIVQNASITLHFSIEKNINAHGLPVNIILSCYTGPFADKSAVENILDNLMHAKEKAGYKFIGYSTIDFYKGENISVSVYQKGTQYAKYGIVDHSYNELAIPYNSEEEKKVNEARALKESLKGQFVYLEVGDLGRKSISTLEHFNF